MALALDTLIQVVVALVMLVIWVGLSIGGFVRETSEGVWITAFLLLLAFVLQFGYFAFFEALWNGQTPGKRREHLRVIKDSGQPITTYDAVARNFLRVVDSFPGIYAVGIVSVLFSSRNKRLGDFVAGTVVVHEAPLEQQTQVSLRYAEKGAVSGYDVTRLSPEEFQVIEAYLLRRTELSHEVRAQLTRQIVQRIASKLEISPEDQQRPEPLLEELATEYRQRAQFQ